MPSRVIIQLILNNGRYKVTLPDGSQTSHYALATLYVFLEENVPKDMEIIIASPEAPLFKESREQLYTNLVNKGYTMVSYADIGGMA